MSEPPASSGGAGPQSFRTADLDSARERVTRVFASHEVHLAGAQVLDFQLDLAPSRLLTIGRMSYGVDATVHAPPIRLCFHVNLPVVGKSTAEQNNVRGTTHAGRASVVFEPYSPLMVHWSADTWHYNIKLPKELLETHAARLLGGSGKSRIEFDLTFDTTAGPGRALLATTSFLLHRARATGRHLDHFPRLATSWNPRS